MKSIVLGYANEKATGQAVVLAGPEVPIVEQVKLVTGIKAGNAYPKGVVRVEYCELISRNVGIRIVRTQTAPAQSETTQTTTNSKKK